MKEIRVERSNLKRYLYFVFALIFTAGSVFILMPHSVALGVLGMLLFGAAAVFVLLKKSPVLLTLTSEGFTDTSSAVPAGFVRWDTVSNIELIYVFGQALISVEIHKLGTYLEQRPLGQQIVADINLTLGYAPINIPLVGATMSAEEVLTHMLAFWEASKKSGPPSTFTPPSIDNTAQNG